VCKEALQVADSARQRIARSIRNGPVRRFFEQEYENFSSSYRTDASAPIQNKVGAFLADPALARMLTTPKREVRIRQVMDEGKVLIVNLAKGRVGEDSSSLLGGLLVTTLGLSAYTRVDTPIAKRREIYDQGASHHQTDYGNLPWCENLQCYASSSGKHPFSFAKLLFIAF
jgi:hypothetical protein